MRGLEKNCMKRDIEQTRKDADGHRDSMKESAKGRFFEKGCINLNAGLEMGVKIEIKAGVKMGLKPHLHTKI